MILGPITGRWWSAPSNRWPIRCAPWNTMLRPCRLKPRRCAAADEGLQLLKTNYAAGLVNYLQILTADNAYQQARLGVIQAQAPRLQDTAALFVALGGGWWNAQTQRGGNDLPRPSKTGMASAGRSPQASNDKLPAETSPR